MTNAYKLKLLLMRTDRPNYTIERTYHAVSMAAAIYQAEADPATLEVLRAEYLYTLGQPEPAND